MKIMVNGVQLFYDVSGSGNPIILLHGNGETHEIFDVLVKELAKEYRVYALDSRDHGLSEKVTKLSYEEMMEDVVCFIKTLNLETPILYGFSDGGIIGLMLAIRYPDLLSKLIVSGANINPLGLKKKYLFIMKIIYFFSRNTQYKMMLTEPNIQVEELHKIKIPTLVLAGDKDMIREEHTRLIASDISICKLQILEKESHMSYVVHSPKLYGIIKSFL